MTATPAHTSRTERATWGTDLPTDFSDPLLDELVTTLAWLPPPPPDPPPPPPTTLPGMPEPDPEATEQLIIEAMTELAHHLGDSGFMHERRWHDLRPAHGPNPVAWLTFINGVLLINGQTLACWCGDDATLGSWYTIGAREWHARWAVR